MRVRTEKSAHEIRLRGAPLGSGGEAVIYALPHDDALAAKIYHKPTAEHVAKLSAMLASPPDDPMAATGHVSIAWPRELLYADERVAGYLMPRVHGARLIQEFYNPRARSQACPRFHYGYLLRTARNLASAVRAIHDCGYVIGDLNESNLLVTNQALVTLVDTDSFQVPGRERTFRCRVGKPEYTPPELQSARFADIDRAPEHDCFGLAVLIFQLLMQGMHPFAGLYSGQGEPGTIPQRIASGQCPYLRSRPTPYRPSPHAPPWAVLPPAVQTLLIRCFDDGFARPHDRPAAVEWHRALHDSEKEMVPCALNPQHVYHQGLTDCPWCVLGRQQGRDPFPSSMDSPRGRAHPTLSPSGAKGREGRPAVEKRTQVVTSLPPSPYARPLYPVGSPVSPPPRRSRLARLLINAGIGGAVAALLSAAGLLGWSFTHKRAELLAEVKGDPAPVAERNVVGTLRVPSDGTRSVPTTQPLRRFEGHTGRVTCVAFSPDGQRLLSGSADLTIRLWEVSSGKELRRFVGHTHWVKSVAFTPDGQRFVSAGFDKTVRLWDLESGRQISTLSAHLDQVMSVAVSADGRFALSGSYDETIRMWELGAVWNQRRLWLRDLVGSVALSPDGRLALCAGSDRSFRLWDLPNGRELRPFSGHNGIVNSVAFSSDGRRALSGSADDTVRLWDIDSGQELRRFSGHEGEVTSVAFVGDGRRFVSGSADNTVRLWDSDTGRDLRCFKANVLGVTSVAVYGDQLLSGGADSSIHLWRLSAGKAGSK